MTNAVKARKMGEELVDGNGTLQGISPSTMESWENTTSNPSDDVKQAMRMIHEKDIHLIIPEMPSFNGNGHAKSVEMNANSCPECKIPMQRTGACWTCSQCGHNTGCG
jgi:ribonucleoside-diphosphate reductase alpha chain